MANKSKYLGEILEGKWKIISVEYNKETQHSYFTLQNQFNNMVIIISDRSFYHIKQGKTTIGHIFYNRINKEHYGKELKEWQKAQK